MQFSNVSHEYIDLLVNHFLSKNILKKNNKDIHREDTIFRKIFKDLQESNNFIQNSRSITRCIKNKKISAIDNAKKVSLPGIYSSMYFPEAIQHEIKMNTIVQILYECIVSGRHVKIRFSLFDDRDDYNKYDNYAKLILMMLHLLSSYGSSECSNELKIHIYMTEMLKELPPNNYTVLNSLHVNSGFTTSCSKNSEIVIFRREEWFKVLIHETFHNLGLDFSIMNTSDLQTKMREIFPIKSEMLVFESYCEFWARMLNCAFASFIMLDDTSDYKTFKHYYEFFIQLELIFSLFQANKILEFLGLTYSELYDKDKVSQGVRETLYREKSNVFCYYILTPLLMNNYVDFISWCDTKNTSLLKFNPTYKNIDELFDFIKSKHSDNEFEERIEKISKIRNRLFKKLAVPSGGRNKNNILNTLRMTSIELA